MPPYVTIVPPSLFKLEMVMEMDIEEELIMGMESAMETAMRVGN